MGPEAAAKAAYGPSIAEKATTGSVSWGGGFSTIGRYVAVTRGLERHDGSTNRSPNAEPALKDKTNAAAAPPSRNERINAQFSRNR